MKELIQLLNDVFPLSPELEAWLKTKIKPYRFKKGQRIVREGEMAPLILYIEKGLIRSYSVVDKKQKSNYFMKEGDIIISVIAFFMQVPAIESIDALEEVIAWGITWDELEEAYQLFRDFNTNGRIIGLRYYCRSELRWHSKHGKTPEDKFDWLMKNEREVISRVPALHVASYLGVGRSNYFKIKRDYPRRLRSKRK